MKASSENSFLIDLRETCLQDAHAQQPVAWHSTPASTRLDSDICDADSEIFMVHGCESKIDQHEFLLQRSMLIVMAISMAK